MRQYMIAGNWKMNTTLQEAEALAAALTSQPLSSHVEVLVCPPFISLQTVGDVLKGSNIQLGAQTMSEHASGAYTGEISGTMLSSCGVTHVILGHSERRQYFGETNAHIRSKLAAAFASSITPILCVGETLAEREAGQENQVVTSQLEEALKGLHHAATAPFLVAYEPVWAIGTGKVATPEQAQAIHALIRSQLELLLGPQVAQSTRILYGGSVKPSNAESLFTMPDIDGALVGGASLNASDFMGIVNAI